MAQFRGTIKGSRGAVSRLGGKGSGLTTYASGWNLGVEVNAWHDEKTGKDYFKVYRTGGSNAQTGRKLIATVK